MFVKRIGPYETIRELGHNSTASVYCAHEKENNKLVALKTISFDLLNDATLFARLKRQIEVLNLLEQPAFVPVYAVVEEEGYILLAMQYMEGGSLAERLAAGPMPVETAFTIIERIAPVLDSAHNVGILHLNLKPTNILFDSDNSVYLSGFESHLVANAYIEESPVTLYGPLSYTSPEQAIRRSNVNEQSDIYSLGALLYQMLSGSSPFQSGSALGYAVMHQIMSLSALPDGVPNWVLCVLKKAMAPQPENRYSSAGELVSDIRQGLEGNLSESKAGFRSDLRPDLEKQIIREEPEFEDVRKPVTARRRPRQTWAWAALLILIFTGGFAGLLRLFPMPGNILSLSPTREITQNTAVAEISGLVIPDPLATGPADKSGLIQLTSSSTPEPPKPTQTSQILNPASTSIPAASSTNVSTLDENLLTSSIPLTYTIAYNDTLFTIASRYNLDLSYLIAINDLHCDTRLYPNKELELPPPGPDQFPANFVELSADNYNSLAWNRILDCVKDVRDLSFSPDGKILAVAEDNYVYFWKVGEWTPLRRLKGHLSKVSSIAFSPDGKVLASAADDRSIRIWSTTDGTQLLSFRAHGNEIKNVVFSPDGSLLVSTSTDLTVKIWDPASGTLLHQLRGYKAYGAAFSPDSNLLAIGYGDSVRVFQTSDYTELFSLPSADPVNELAFSPDGNLLASSSDVWQVSERKHIYHLQSSGDKVLFSNDGTLLMVGRKGWRVSNGSLVSKLEVPVDETPRTQYAWESIAISPDGKLLAWGTQDSLTIWGTNTSVSALNNNLYHVQTGDTYFNIAKKFKRSLKDLLKTNGLTCQHVIYPEQPLNVQTANVENYALMELPALGPENLGNLNVLSNYLDMTCADALGTLAFSPDGRSLVSGGSLWDLTRNSLLILETNVSFQEENAEGARVPSPAFVFSPTGSLSAVRSGNQIKLWDTETGSLVRILEGHTDKVAGLAFSPDGSLLASGSSTYEKNIRLWNTADGSLVRTIPGVAAKNLSFTPDGQTLMTAWEDDTIRFWKIADGSLIRTLQGIQGKAVLSPDGTSLAFIACSEKAGIRCIKQVVNLFRIEDGVIYNTLPGLKDYVQDVIWSPDGKRIILASEYAVLEWDVNDSTLVRKLDPGPERRKTLARLYLSPSSSLLLAVADDDTIYFWDYKTGSLALIRRINHDYLAFSPLDNLLSVFSSGKVSLWGIQP